MGTRATVATDGARVMVWMGEDEREIMVEGEGGMEEGASCATGMISATEMKNTQVKLRAQCVVLYVSGQSAKFLLREPYDRIWPISPVFVQPIMAPARTITAVQIPVLGAYGTAPMTVKTGCTPVGPAMARSPNMIDLGKSPGITNQAALIAAVIAYRQHPPLVGSGSPSIPFSPPSAPRKHLIS